MILLDSIPIVSNGENVRSVQATYMDSPGNGQLFVSLKRGFGQEGPARCFNSMVSSMAQDSPDIAVPPLWQG